MKRIKAAAVLLAVAAMGCASLNELGLKRDAIPTGVEMFLARQGLSGLVTPEQVKEFITIIEADQRMQAMALQVQGQIAADVRLQERIAELGSRYLPGGVPTDPSTNAPAPVVTTPEPAPAPAGDPNITVTPGRT